MLAVHHLDGPATVNLFYRVASVLAAGGRFVLADLVVPDNTNDVVTPIDGIDDTPSSLADQLNWLPATCLRTEVNWQHRDLAITTSTKST